MRRSKFVTGIMAASLLLLTACGGDEETSANDTAQSGESDYPSESIRLIVPYGAGGLADNLARTVGDFLSEELGETVVVENKAGGSGALATQELINSPADGHTLALVTVGTLVSTPLSNDVGYTKDDVQPVGLVGVVPSVLAVSKDSPHQSAEEFFDFARENGGKLSVGVPGATTPQAIELDRLASEYDIEVTPVPFSTDAEASTALLGSNLDAVFVNTSPPTLEYIDTGDFVPLAISTPLEIFPDLPTLVDVGFEKLTLGTSYTALAGPAGMPEDVVDILESAVEKALQDPEVRERIGEESLPLEFEGEQAVRDILDEAQEVYTPILGK